MRSLILSSLVFSQLTWAAGGNHDGGGQAVRAADGQLQMADHFTPSTGKKPLPEGRTVDLDLQFPQLRPSIQLLSGMLGIYGQGNADLVWRVYDDKARYVFVDELPDHPSCRVPRDNSGVPIDAVVFHVACTLGETTYLLESGVRALNPDGLAELVVHEALRRERTRMETASIEIIVSGLSTAVRAYRKQRAGDRSALSEEDLRRLNDLIEEIPRTALRDHNQFARPNPGMKLTVHGGRLGPYDDETCEQKCRSPRVAPDAVIGAGSYVRVAEVGAGSVILGTTIAHDGGGDGKIASGVYLENAIFGDGDLDIADGVRVTDSVLEAAHLIIERGAKLTDVRAYPTDMVIGAESELADVKFLQRRGDEQWVPVKIGSRVKLKTVQLMSPFKGFYSTGTEKKRLIEIGDDASLDQVNVQFTLQYRQGAGSYISNLNLRVRSLELGESLGKVQPVVEIARDARIEGGGQTLVFLANPWFFQESKLTFTGRLELSQGAMCAMGFDASTKQEVGVEFGQDEIRSVEQLKTCRTSAPLAARKCVRREGCSGYELEKLFPLK